MLAFFFLIFDFILKTGFVLLCSHPRVCSTIIFVVVVDNHPKSPTFG